MNGAQVLWRSLENHGIKTVFGIPGGVLLKLYDEMKGTSIHHVLTRHEQGAAHAADGYARATGEVGVCIATSGPGAANLITGLGTALSDSVPLLAITGQVKTSALGKDSFQEINTIGLSQAVTKHNYLVKDAKDIPRIVSEAMLIAKSGRPGPVLIDICADVYAQVVDETIFDNVVIPDYIINKFSNPVLKNRKIKKVVDALNASKKPLLLVGNGINLSVGASDLLLEFVEKTDLLVVNTIHGKGAFNETHPNSLKMLGMHGTKEANYAIQNCDLLINIGSRFDDRITCNLDYFLEKCEYIVHVDIDPSEFGKNVKTNLAVLSDSYDFLESMLNQSDLIVNRDDREWKKECLSQKSIHSEVEKPVFFTREINRVINDSTTIVTDVGQHQMFAALHMYPTKNRKFLTSGGLGTMGFGLPGAIGAAFANPSDNIILITGDGSFQMTLQELAVVKQHNLNIKIVIYDNNALGMVRQWQEMFYKENYSHSIFEVKPDWRFLAMTYGIDFAEVKSEDDETVLHQALNKQGPVLIHLHLETYSNVFPMVPSTDSLSNVREG